MSAAIDGTGASDSSYVTGATCTLATSTANQSFGISLTQNWTAVSAGTETGRIQSAVASFLGSN